METLIRICKFCENSINLLKGRKDRLFCDETCKNRYHNTQIYEEQQEIKRVQLILKRNRRVLKKMFVRKDRDLLDKIVLLKEGFEFDYHTHFVTSKIKKNQFTFCFDYGYRSVGEDRYKVIKAFEYKEE